jgi:hypothetical protein
MVRYYLVSSYHTALQVFVSIMKTVSPCITSILYRTANERLSSHDMHATFKKMLHLIKTSVRVGRQMEGGYDHTKLKES